MARPKASIPKYSKHTRSGQAVVYINRKTVYLGPYDSAESRKRYSEIIAHQDAPAGQSQESAAAKCFTVSNLCKEFVRVKFPTYKTSEGAESAECDCFRGVIRILRTAFGETPVNDFGPKRLLKVREKMLKEGWTRNYINKQIGRTRYMFRLGVSWEMVEETVYSALKTIDPLRRGVSTAPEGVEREAVPSDRIALMKGHLKEIYCDMSDLILLSAARPGELVSLTTGIIDRQGEVWSADFKKHKTAHHGHKRVVHFGRQAQEILSKYLKPFEPDAKIFPVKRNTFGNAVKRACAKAGIPRFTPHWLRHTAVTNIADEMDMETAQRVAGHSTVAMTIQYAKAAKKKASEAIRKLG